MTEQIELKESLNAGSKRKADSIVSSEAEVSLEQGDLTEGCSSRYLESALGSKVNGTMLQDVSTGVETFKSENEYKKLRWVIVNNDGDTSSMIRLVGLKSLFSKQLPSEY